MPVFRLMLIVVAVLFLAGCTQVVEEGGAKVFQYTKSGKLLFALIGGVSGFLGGVVMYNAVKPGNGMGILGRIYMLPLGLAMLITGYTWGISPLFSAERESIAVHSDRVVISDGSLTTEFPFSEIQSIETYTGDKSSRRLLRFSNQFMSLKRYDGSSKSYRFESLQKTAYDTLLQQLANYQGTHGSGEIKSSVVYSGSSGTVAASGSLSIPSLPAVKRFPINVTIPASGSILPHNAEVTKGMKLGACYNGALYVVTVDEIHTDGTLSCNWDKLPANNSRMERGDLIIPTAQIKLASVPVSSPQQATAVAAVSSSPASSPVTHSRYSLKRYPISAEIPAGHSLVKAETTVPVGLKLGAYYATNWHPVTVKELNSDGTITCNWDDWPSYTYKMLREDLIIKEGGASFSRIGRYSAHNRINANNANANNANADLDPRRPERDHYVRGGVTPYPMWGPIPPNFTQVLPDSKIREGQKLAIYWSGKWNPVTVLKVNSDGTLIGQFDGWRTIYKMQRSDLAMKK